MITRLPAFEQKDELKTLPSLSLSLSRQMSIPTKRSLLAAGPAGRPGLRQ